MTPSQFQSADFSLSETGIHLLRNNFNYKTLSYGEITRARMTRSTEIRNAPIILCLGIAMVAFGFFQGANIVSLFIDPSQYHIYIETILRPVIPGFLGV